MMQRNHVEVNCTSLEFLISYKHSAVCVISTDYSLLFFLWFFFGKEKENDTNEVFYYNGKYIEIEGHKVRV